MLLLYVPAALVAACLRFSFVPLAHTRPTGQVNWRSCSVYFGVSLCFALSLATLASDEDEDDQDGHFFYNHPERGAYFAA